MTKPWKLLSVTMSYVGPYQWQFNLKFTSSPGSRNHNPVFLLFSEVSSSSGQRFMLFLVCCLFGHVPSWLLSGSAAKGGMFPKPRLFYSLIDRISTLEVGAAGENLPISRTSILTTRILCKVGHEHYVWSNKFICCWHPISQDKEALMFSTELGT